MTPFPVRKYDLIMADPPWAFRLFDEETGAAKSAQAHYSCASLSDICDFPVASIARPDCLLWLWATNPMLDQAFTVLDAWGFTFKTAGTWVKMTKKGGLAFGTGYRLRSANEPFLIATRGNPETTNGVCSAIMATARQHSRKPDEAFDAAEQLMPHARRIELFSRQKMKGWDVWGDQTHRFGEDG
ncbi:MAG: MT-A70 family methyltransferase [Pseudomonadota bacterium]